MTLELFHTQEYSDKQLNFPVLAEGNEQWLGDGYYFWQAYEFAKWWGESKKCKRSNIYRRYSIFKATLTFTEDQFIDTVFKEEDYNNFVNTIEKFALKFVKEFKCKPSLEEFNDFIADKGLWEEIKVIRFQDIPENDSLMSVNGYYYKKRIQFRVNDPKIITTFALLKTLYCV